MHKFLYTSLAIWLRPLSLRALGNKIATTTRAGRWLAGVLTPQNLLPCVFLLMTLSAIAFVAVCTPRRIF